MIRLDKLIGELNIASRSEAKSLIKNGRIKVNGIVAKSGQEKIDETTAVITYDNKDYSYIKFRYFVMYKPSNVVTANVDNLDVTVMDLFRKAYPDLNKDYNPVGRLDKDTTGLLLITNDGILGHRLLSPKHHVPKTYEVTIKKPLSNEDISRIETGIELKDFTTLPAKIDLIDNYHCLLTITEGKFHEVKRIFIALDNEVISLHRISFGPLVLDDDMKSGDIIELEESSIKELTSEKDN